jgi:hypothetical protein
MTSAVGSMPRQATEREIREAIRFHIEGSMEG